MPVYEYRCESCGRVLTDLHGPEAETDLTCCGALVRRPAMFRTLGPTTLEDSENDWWYAKNKASIESMMASDPHIEITKGHKTPRQFRANPPKRVH